MKVSGGCHCSSVRFDVETESPLPVIRCNCSICSMTGFLHLIVPQQRFHLLRGADKLTTYRFNTKTAQHHFCSGCGVKSFYVPRSHPDGISVNVHCLENWRELPLEIVEFDGSEWDKNADKLSPLSD